jgi:hypothetical protein
MACIKIPGKDVIRPGTLHRTWWLCGTFHTFHAMTLKTAFFNDPSSSREGVTVLDAVVVVDESDASAKRK